MNSMTCDGEDKANGQSSPLIVLVGLYNLVNATSAVIGCCPCSIRVQTHVLFNIGAILKLFASLF